MRSSAGKECFDTRNVGLERCGLVIKVALLAVILDGVGGVNLNAKLLSGQYLAFDLILDRQSFRTTTAISPENCRLTAQSSPPFGLDDVSQVNHTIAPKARAVVFH